MKKAKAKVKKSKSKVKKVTFASIASSNIDNSNDTIHEAYNRVCDRVVDLEGKLYNLKNDQQIQRNKVITEWLSSLASINTAIAQAIGEGASNVR